MQNLTKEQLNHFKEFGFLKVENLIFNKGTINAEVFDKDDYAPIQIGKEFEYNAGTLKVIADPGEKDPEGP